MKRNTRKIKALSVLLTEQLTEQTEATLRLLCFIYFVIISYPATFGNNDAVSDADNEAINDAIRQHPVINYNT